MVKVHVRNYQGIHFKMWVRIGTSLTIGHSHPVRGFHSSLDKPYLFYTGVGVRRQTG